MGASDAVGIHHLNVGSEYTEEELEFLREVERYMKKHKRRFPTFCEVLRVAKAMGYLKVHKEQTNG